MSPTKKKHKQHSSQCVFPPQINKTSTYSMPEALSKFRFLVWDCSSNHKNQSEIHISLFLKATWAIQHIPSNYLYSGEYKKWPKQTPRFLCSCNFTLSRFLLYSYPCFLILGINPSWTLCIIHTVVSLRVFLKVCVTHSIVLLSSVPVTFRP